MKRGFPLLLVAMMAGCSSLTRSEGSLEVFSTHLAPPSPYPTGSPVETAVVIDSNDTVAIQLSGQNQSAFTTILASDYFEGGGDGSYLFQSVPTGTYTVKVIVYDAAGNDVLEAPTRTVTIVAGSTTSASVFTRLNPDPTADPDDDGIVNGEDNCPWNSNTNQLDGDGDTVGDACDNCPTVFNPDQTDTISPNIGDACNTGPAAVHYPAIGAIFNSNSCTSTLVGCHSGLAPEEGLSFDTDDDGYSQLVNISSQENAALYRVAPGSPSLSYLYLKITGSPSITGTQMPPSALLSSADLSVIQTWIEQGANP